MTLGVAEAGAEQKLDAWVGAQPQRAQPAQMPAAAGDMADHHTLRILQRFQLQQRRAAATVTLARGERSRLADFASEVL